MPMVRVSNGGTEITQAYNNLAGSFSGLGSYTAPDKGACILMNLNLSDTGNILINGTIASYIYTNNLGIRIASCKKNDVLTFSGGGVGTAVMIYLY